MRSAAIVLAQYQALRLATRAFNTTAFVRSTIFANAGTVQHNEALRTRKMAAHSQARDFNVGDSDSVYRCNYSHDKEGGALLLMNDTSRNYLPLQHIAGRNGFAAGQLS